MNPEPAFRAGSAAHLLVIFLTVAVPLLLAWWARGQSSAVVRAIEFCLAALLIANLIGYEVFRAHEGSLTWRQALPMQLCDWTMFAVMGAMVTRRRGFFEVAYFWGIGGTLQAILTPNLQWAFPDIRFISFFVAHSGIVAAIVFIMLTRGWRPHSRGLWLTIAWSEFYLAAALLTNWLTGANYGFLAHKPRGASLLSALSDWRPLYLVEMNALALVFFAVLYAPFAIYDAMKVARSIPAITHPR